MCSTCKEKSGKCLNKLVQNLIVQIKSILLIFLKKIKLFLKEFIKKKSVTLKDHLQKKNKKFSWDAKLNGKSKTKWKRTDCSG